MTFSQVSAKNQTQALQVAHIHAINNAAAASNETKAKSTTNTNTISSLISSKAAALGAVALYVASQATEVAASVVSNPANQTAAKDTLAELTKNVSPKVVEAWIKTGLAINAIALIGAAAGVVALPCVACCFGAAGLNRNRMFGG